MASLYFFLITALSFCSCTQARSLEPSRVPEGWKKIEAGKFLTFYLPKDMQLVNDLRCIECAWGSKYSDGQVTLYAEYTSWNGEYASYYLAKQADYVKEIATIDGHRAKIQGWRLQEPVDGFHFTQEVRIYDHAGKLKARMAALCKGSADVEVTKDIFRTIHFLQP